MNKKILLALTAILTISTGPISAGFLGALKKSAEKAMQSVNESAMRVAETAQQKLLRALSKPLPKQQKSQVLQQVKQLTPLHLLVASLVVRQKM